MRPTILSLLAVMTFTNPSHAGYSHYWTWKKSPESSKVQKCIEDMKKVLAASKVPLAGAEGEGTPSIMHNSLVFNQRGDEENIGEPFVFPGRTGMNFCKTNGKDYDPVVVACLLVVMDHFTPEEVSIKSDGDMKGGDWDEGIELYKKVLGKNPNLTATKDGVLGVLKNIASQRKWSSEHLWIAAGLLAFAGVAAWWVFNPRPDFQIMFQRDGNAHVLVKFPEAHVGALRTFFKQDLPMKRNACVRGWYDKGGRVRLDFAGPISDREQQRVRNFFSTLRLAV